MLLLLYHILGYNHRATRIKTIVVKHSVIPGELSGTHKQITDSGLHIISVLKWRCLDITFHTLTNAQNTKDLSLQ